VKLTVYIRSQAGAVQAFCPDLPGCSAAASSEQVALERLRARIDEYFAVRGTALPPGTRAIQLEV
jgi:predicted RNase H-like HicB family nuclease